jgi:hypothetical protein
MKKQILDEEWGVHCLDKWESWYGAFATPAERRSINRIRDKISNPRTSEGQIIDLYLDGIEYLHPLLIKKIKHNGARIINERLAINPEGDILGHSYIEYEFTSKRKSGKRSKGR